MRVLVVGSGGREAALAWRLAQSPSVSALFVTASNPSWPAGAELRPASTVDAHVAVARDVGAELVVVGPETWLDQGIVDAMDVPSFGPTRAAARIETSKAFAKDVLVAAGVPTAAGLSVDLAVPSDREAARQRCLAGSVVIKADGLAAGKGVVVCGSAEEALAALDALAGYGRLVLEDRLEGPEVSVFALSDGERVVALPPAQDHKQLLDGGRGPNTGGMGAYAPCPLVNDVDRVVADVHAPVVRELARRGTPFRGVLYAGLMLTADGPRVLEFNARFGDPECQPLMALWDDDPVPWLHGAATGRLPAGKPRFRAGAACCVVLASAGYPAGAEKGVAIPEPEPRDGVVVFHAGTARGDDGVLRTAGGRVLGITGVGVDLAGARANAYAALPGWRFPGAQWRTDIGGPA